MLGHRCLESLLEVPDVEVVGILTSRESFSISYSREPVTNVLHTDFHRLSNSHHIPLWSMERSMDESGLKDKVFATRPDVMFVAGWYHMIPRSWREDVPAYALHASLLPRYRGGAPLVWAIINGERETGVTLFEMDDGVDTGPILAQSAIRIGPLETIASLLEKVEEHSLSLVKESFRAFLAGDLRPLAQTGPQTEQMSQRTPEDGRIDFSKNIRYVDRFIRAQTHPYPGAFFDFEGSRIRVWSAMAAPDFDRVPLPGLIQYAGGNFYFACLDGWMQGLECERSGSGLGGGDGPPPVLFSDLSPKS